MKITVIGSGYVGLTTGACLADKGNFVICADNDLNKIRLLKKGKIPFYEPGLQKLVLKNLKNKNLSFSSDLKTAIQNSDVIFCCVWTPPGMDFKPDIKAVFDVAQKFGRHINADKIFIVKSTVPVGANEKCRTIIQNELRKRKAEFKFAVVSNPEFLRQGAAVKDTMRPDRIVAGIENSNVKKIISQLYKPFKTVIFFTDLRTAELVKYAANAFLALKISFINEMANFSDLKNCNIKDIEKALKLDKRIGPYYLSSGTGYGGGCLRKDIKGLINQGEEGGFNFSLLNAAEKINEKQKLLPYFELKKKLRNLKNKKIAVWGVAFKPGTDSVKEAASVKIVQKLLRDKARVAIYDPEASDNFMDLFKKNKNITKAKSALDAAKNADALLILAKWPEFKKIKLKNIILDGAPVLDLN